MIRALIISILLMGCVSTTKITGRDGRVIQVESQKDAIVTFQDKDLSFTVDNRGRPSTFDELIKLYFMTNQINQNTGE